jgi:sugar (pentulose or hexulose) kinase
VPAPPLEGEELGFDPEAYVAAVLDGLARVGRTDKGSAIEALCFSSQRATLLCIGRDGNPLGPALSWQGTVCASDASSFFESFGGDAFLQRTGLPPSPTYSVSKLAYLRCRHPDMFSSAAHFCTLQDFVLRRLGADGWFVDHSNASAMGLYDIEARDWAEDVLAGAGVERSRLSSVMQAGAEIGGLSPAVARRTSLTAGTPLRLGGGDQQCALLGSGMGHDGEWVLSLGTAAVATVAMSELPRNRQGGTLLLSHVLDGAWTIEGFVNAFGSCIGWAGGLLGWGDVAELETVAAVAPPGSDGVVFVPSIAGVGSPDCDGDIRGAFFGLSQLSDRAALGRAVIEGLACELRRVLDALRPLQPVRVLRAVGGARGGRLLPQIVADVVGLPLALDPSNERASLGAAALAFAAMQDRSPVDVVQQWDVTEVPCLEPRLDDSYGATLYERYLKALNGLSAFHQRRLAGNG